jgi:hypothetical protein
MRICVVTLFTEEIEKESKLSTLNKKKYCEKYNIDYRFFYGRASERHAQWDKIQCLIQTLPEYDYVVWMDSDTVFNNFNISLIDLIDRNLNYDGLLCSDVCYSEGVTHLMVNTGVMIFKNTEWSSRLLNKVWNSVPDYSLTKLDKHSYDGFPHEQGKMCEELVELFCKTNKISAIGLRFFTVYGPGGRPDMAIFNFIKKIKFGEPITIYGDGSMQRDFTYVTDIVNGIYNCMFLNLNSGEHKLYNIGNNNPISLIKLIEICEEVIEKKAIIMYDNIPTGDVPITYANIDKAKNELKYIPSVNLLQGIKNMYSWFNNLNIKV